MSATALRCAAAALVFAGLGGVPAQARKKQPTVEVDLAENGGFESGLGGWRTLNMSGRCAFVLDADTRKSGKQSLRITRDGPGAKDFVKHSVALPVREGKLRVRLQYCVAKGARLTAQAYFYDAEGETLGRGFMKLADSSKTRGFKGADETYEIPENATGVGVNVEISQPGTVWIDDLEILCAMATGLRNPGFEEGLESWSPIEAEAGRATLAIDSKKKTAGKRALRVERASHRLQPEDGAQSLVLGVEGAKRVRLRYRAQTDGDARTAAALQVFAGTSRCLATARSAAAPDADGFGRHEVDLDVPAGAQRLMVSLLVSGRGSAWFDDVELELR